MSNRDVLISFVLFCQLLYEHTDPIPGEEKWPVIGQFSSIGSMGLDKTKWLAGEFQRTLTTLGKSSLRPDPPIHLVRSVKCCHLLVCCSIQTLRDRCEMIEYKWDNAAASAAAFVVMLSYAAALQLSTGRQ